MGECPDWYPLIVAARYLRVPPWELMKQPLVWRDWAMQAKNAEVRLQNQEKVSL